MVSQSPDIKITTEAPVRAPSSVPVDDAVLAFEVGALDLRGRLTRLGPALDEILHKHDYPPAVGKLLGEAIAGQASRGFDLFDKVPHMTFPGGKHLRSPLLALGMLWHRLKEVL